MCYVFDKRCHVLLHAWHRFKVFVLDEFVMSGRLLCFIGVTDFDVHPSHECDIVIILSRLECDIVIKDW